MTKKIIEQQQQQQQRTRQILERQTRVLETMSHKSNETCTTLSYPPDAVANSIGEFLYNLEGAVCLWYCRRYEEIF